MLGEAAIAAVLDLTQFLQYERGVEDRARNSQQSSATGRGVSAEHIDACKLRWSRMEADHREAGGSHWRVVAQWLDGTAGRAGLSRQPNRRKGQSTVCPMPPDSRSILAKWCIRGAAAKVDDHDDVRV